HDLATIEYSVSNNGVRTLVCKASASFCAFLTLIFMPGAAGKIPQRYPNELKGFQFYEKYLAPLQPRVSDSEAVRRILGDTAAVRRNVWKIYTTYEAKSGPVSNPTLGALAEIILARLRDSHACSEILSFVRPVPQLG